MFLNGTIECPCCGKVIDYCGNVESAYFNDIAYCNYCKNLVELSGYVELIIDCATKRSKY